MIKKTKKTLRVHFYFKPEELKIKEHAHKNGNASEWYRKAALALYEKEKKVIHK